MKWTDIALIGGIAIAVGIVAKQTGAGKGLVEVAEGLTEVGVSPFRAAGRGLGELGTGITQFSASIGGIGKGIGEAFGYVTGGLQGLLGLGEQRTEARPTPPPTTTSPYTPTPNLPPPDYLQARALPSADVGILYQLGFTPAQVASLRGTTLKFDPVTASRLGLRPETYWLT